MTNLGRADVERIVENVLRNLSVEVTPTYNSNILKLDLKYKGEIVSQTRFSINEEDYSE